MFELSLDLHLDIKSWKLPLHHHHHHHHVLPARPSVRPSQFQSQEVCLSGALSWIEGRMNGGAARPGTGFRYCTVLSVYLIATYH